MIRLMRFLITGDWHLHKWKDVKKIHTYYDPTDKMPVSGRIVCKCEHCGSYKSFRI